MDKDAAKQKRTIFDQEITPHLSSLKRYAIKMTRNFDDSKDLLQDTLLKAFRFFDSFEEGSNTGAWLFTIMKNSFLNDYRKRIKKPFMVDYNYIQNFITKSDDRKDENFQEDGFRNVDDEILNAISLLPKRSRTIMYLSVFEGYSYEEIAKCLACPIGTVRSRLHRTRKLLYKLLYKYAKNNGYVRSEVIKQTT